MDGRNVADTSSECEACAEEGDGLCALLGCPAAKDVAAAERLAQLEAKVRELAVLWRRLAAETSPTTPAGEGATRTLEACAHDLLALIGEAPR